MRADSGLVLALIVAASALVGLLAWWLAHRRETTERARVELDVAVTGVEASLDRLHELTAAGDAADPVERRLAGIELERARIRATRAMHAPSVRRRARRR